jgi:hypothetical protein
MSIITRIGSPESANSEKNSLRIHEPKPRRRSLFGFIDAEHTSPIEKSSTPGADSMNSSISYEECPEPDLQSILVSEDMKELEGVDFCETVPFVPAVQYGKVLQINSGSEFVMAARVYNGYTKMLRPKLYRFTIKLRHIPDFKSLDKEKYAIQLLTKMILNKVVHLRKVESTGTDKLCADVIYEQLYINNYILSNITSCA